MVAWQALACHHDSLSACLLWDPGAALWAAQRFWGERHGPVMPLVRQGQQPLYDDSCLHRAFGIGWHAAAAQDAFS
eukprot:6170213-Amphidinium_carterae.1